MKSTYALILAAGEGKRFKWDLPKTLYKLNGKTILEMAINKFLDVLPAENILVVVHADYLDLYQDIFANKNLLAIISGGKERGDSVKAGLDFLSKLSPEKVLIHDGARPFVSKDLIEQVIYHLDKEEAVIPTIKVTDTIKLAHNNHVETTLDRERVFRAQTPQGFIFQKIYACYQENNKLFTDDSSLFEQSGGKVLMIEGEDKNIKITYKEDIEKINTNRMFYSGFGYDVHKFASEKKDNNQITLGGVAIDHPYQIIAHSDGDVLLHALVDAMLGASGMGDIGYHYPPSDKQYENRDSSFFVLDSASKLEELGFQIVNVDCLIICEKPNINLHREKIRESIAKMLKMDKNKVNIKATTTEGLGFTGRREGIASKVIISLYKNEMD
jgi:2-C-methyl-D-erythritol 4-phosphate cytidylyltransferase/2-C-methyl-D-erythritol 2,4-cyclodiphosphate synthase